MSRPSRSAAVQALLLTKGHRFDREAFLAFFAAMPRVAVTEVEHPEALAFYSAEHARAYDALVFYDMPGIEFRSEGPVFREPPAQAIRDFEARLASGQGLVFLHHAIAGWPLWEGYAEVMGARFLYEAAPLRGRQQPASGYRHGVRHRLRPAPTAHPVLEGLEAGFEIEDELYLCSVFEEDLVPLLYSDARFRDDAFYSASRAVHGERDSRRGWSHPPGSSCLAWARRAGRSPVVTILCGDGPTAYANPSLRRLVENAIVWVAAPEARHWAGA